MSKLCRTAAQKGSSGWLPAVLLFLLLLTLGGSSGSATQEWRQAASRETLPSGGYVGSKVCAPCHRSEFDSFSRTGMGRSMTTVTPALLAKLPPSAAIFDPQRNRHFSVFVRQGQLYQSEWETDAEGTDVFRETEPIEWIIGSGANAMGGIVRRGDRLFEAPLTYYTKTHAWALSPGYLEADRGFSRPVEAECVACHSTRPDPVANTIGEFHDPPFEELAIGCEKCHGPGAAHIREKRSGAANPDSATPSIVNPSKLSAWLADNICMSCHQNGDARVLQPGKTVQDFLPGEPLDHTLAILMVPPTRESPPSADHVQHYFSMTLSKCYRSSAAKLSCITCHDPHVQPTREGAPAYYRGKCMLCHTETSCTAPVATRQQTTPADDCIGCHMPKRDVAGISHASLTNHRIVGTADEPFPEVAFQLTTPSLPDLLHVNAIPGQPDATPPQITLLQAYGQLGVEHREYLQRYYEVAQQLATSAPNNVHVLEALAANSLQQGTAEGNQAAMEYLNRAIAQGSITPWDFEQLGTQLLKARNFPEASACLRKGMQRAPYDAKLYLLLAECDVAMNRLPDAALTLRQAMRLFPQVDALQQFLSDVNHMIGSQQGTKGP
jgi:Cytochrome c554 and c-prime